MTFLYLLVKSREAGHSFFEPFREGRGQATASHAPNSGAAFATPNPAAQGRDPAVTLCKLPM